MLNLIKLEFKKYKLYKYIYYALLCIVGIIEYITVTNLLTQKTIQSSTTYEMIFWIVDVIVIGTFLIFSSILTKVMIMDEYRDRTILNIFSYPISRKKIILAKLLIIIMFTIVFLLISNIICTGYMIFLELNTGRVEGIFNLKHFIVAGPVISVCVGVVLSLVPFIVGIFKKSGIATIITSIVIAAFMPNIISTKNIYLVIDPKYILIKLSIMIIILIVAMFYIFKNEIDNIEKNNFNKEDIC